MTYRVIIQPRAHRDIRATAQWIDDQSKSSARALRWVRGIRARINTLKANPKRCPVDPDSNAFGAEVRVLLYGKRYGKHRVLFTIQGDTVRVLTVRHSARQSLSEEMGRDEADDEDGGTLH
jgi:plasmid stabilization system protein ParE